ncbi:MAG: hypothetical protein AUJ34_03515 [Parcubacteria group bacterium CG1_02_41_12]|nr:MAG: hypothetical protein AUJ34_03515 [Parcubacteria group bacterium CG1_02_41_12]PIP67236.1 MAG: hypothetical protein COW93_01340 [Parcubacteria group bacterium CG22_combo_CG10-13_8_21_14_all_41_9]PIQ78923.1 MAG: hypothetical protein COV79_04805 [Parcubacteria group bacterium CG11_big_fil_rev_8_21_14_0_20_41_14]PIR56743.1 MAG: hypothetical protein COU72_04525 [Parcubacteria group bacterium CG10_big_fil_rev_8_21_14_0_10_41_35]
MKKIISILAVIIVVCAVFFNRVRVLTIYDEWREPALPEAVAWEETVPNDDAMSSDIQGDPSTPGVPFAQNDDTTPQPPTFQGGGVPLEYNLAVPFQSQAPRANWDLPYQEACEEASLIMAHAFFNGTGLTADSMETSINKLVDWEMETFGYYKDTTSKEVELMAKEYFGLSAELDYEVSADNIKKYISQNKLVLVPAAGRMLPNPYFSGDGPLYHMLIIRGYTLNGKFITNDPGTKRGEAFLYSYDDLLNAIHDWPRAHGGYKDNVSEQEMASGELVMIVVDKQRGL